MRLRETGHPQKAPAGGFRAGRLARYYYRKRASSLMRATIKSAEEQQRMRVAGQLAAEVLDMIEAHVRPGISTGELDRICHDYITEQQKAVPAPLNYRGFPRSICTSPNHVVCHGIPGKRRLKNGDMLNIDITVIKDGFHGDTSRIFHVGQPRIKAQRLARVTLGMAITVEPMLNEGRPETRLLPDGWTVVTRDRKLSAQWEHTVLVTAGGYEVLTLGAGPLEP